MKLVVVSGLIAAWYRPQPPPIDEAEGIMSSRCPSVCVCVCARAVAFVDRFAVDFYAVSRKKQDTKLLPVTFAYVNRFSKFFHWQTHW